MLEREIEVGHTGGHDRVDKFVVESRRVEIEQSDPLDPIGDGPNEVDDGPGGALLSWDTVRIAPVDPPRSQVLSDENDLPDPVSQGCDLVQEIAGGP